MSFGCERSCSSHMRVSYFNSNVPQGGIYPQIQFERDKLNIFRDRALTSSGSTGGECGGGGDAKTIISPNTSFGEIIRSSLSRFRHFSESLAWPIGSHIWSLFGPIHIKS